jgi:hypothetical protein
VGGVGTLFSRSETVRVPGGNMPPVHRPPGAASFRVWILGRCNTISAKNIQHTVRYSELSPERFRDFWKD